MDVEYRAKLTYSSADSLFYANNLGHGSVFRKQSTPGLREGVAVAN